MGGEGKGEEQNDKVGGEGQGEEQNVSVWLRGDWLWSFVRLFACRILEPSVVLPRQK